MKNKKYIAVISLLLALVMLLCACQNDGGNGYVEDTPVTAEPVFSNFIKFEEEKTEYMKDIELVSDTMGNLVETSGDLAVFHKDTKDKFNVATQTVTLYSISQGKVLAEIKNTFACDFGWKNEFGHEVLPEKLISQVDIEVYNDSASDREIPYIVIEWEINKPIGDEAVKTEDYSESYVSYNSYDFYDVNGQYIGSKMDSDTVGYVESNDYYTLLSFGKNVAMFDIDGKMVKSYNGDVEAMPVLYDVMNEKYNYIYVPNGITDSSQELYRGAIEVYDKSGNLVCRYNFGEYITLGDAIPLAGGDVLIQQFTLTEEAYSDYDGANIDTFLLDVETGKVTELADFKYIIIPMFDGIGNIVYADGFEGSIADGIVPTENVRNVISGALNYETDERCTIFIDNCGNVNYALNYAIDFEMSEQDDVVEVLDANHMLVEISSGVADYAILDAEGKHVAYLPDGAIVLEDCIIYDEYVYDFNMNKIHKVDSSVYYYLNNNDAVKYAEFANIIVLVSTSTYSDSSYVMLYDAKLNSSWTYHNSKIEYCGVDGNDFVVIKNYGDNNKYNYIVVNAMGYTIIESRSANYIEFSVCESDGAILVEIDENVYRISMAEYTEEMY